MAQRKHLGIFYTDALARQPELEFYSAKSKSFRTIKAPNFDEFFLDADLNCIYCPSMGVHCDFFLTTLDADHRQLFARFLEHLKETETHLERFLVKPVGTKAPVPPAKLDKSYRSTHIKRTPNDRTSDYPLRTPMASIKREWPGRGEDSGGSPSKRTRASVESPSDEVQSDEIGTSQRVLRHSTTIQTYNRQLCRSPPNLHRPTVKFSTKSRSSEANVRPPAISKRPSTSDHSDEVSDDEQVVSTKSQSSEANVRPPAISKRPSISDHSDEVSDDEQVVISSNDLRIKEFTIPLVPIERILRKSNGKFLNSYLLDKMMNQSRIDLSDFESSNRPTSTATTTGQQSGYQSKHTTGHPSDHQSKHPNGQQTGGTVHDHPNDHSPTSEVPSTCLDDSGILSEHSYYQKDGVRPAAAAESSGIQDRFRTEDRMPADQMCSPQSKDSAGLSLSPTSTNCVQNEDELLDLDFGSDLGSIESDLLNSSLNFSYSDLFFALEKDANLVNSVASDPHFSQSN